MGRRTKARECAFQMLYQWELTRAPMDELVESFWRLRSTTEATRARADELFRGTQAALAEIEAAIEEASTNWRPERMASVDRTVLRLGAYELLHEPETPAAVVLDEAVELAKRFGEGDSHAFVNGVLDAIRKRVRGDTPAARRVSEA
jgi:transcription antitermination protein NusB